MSFGTVDRSASSKPETWFCESENEGGLLIDTIAMRKVLQFVRAVTLVPLPSVNLTCIFVSPITFCAISKTRSPTHARCDGHAIMQSGSVANFDSSSATHSRW